MTVYRGLDISPLGVDLFSEHCTSPVPANSVTNLKDKRLDRSSRSKDDAEDLVRTMYREQLLAATEPAQRSSVPPVDQLDEACPSG